MDLRRVRAVALRFLPRQRACAASPTYQLVGEREILRENLQNGAATRRRFTH